MTYDKMTYNMTINPPKILFYPNSDFWRYRKTGATVLVGAIPEKFSKMKNLCSPYLLI